MTEFNFEHSFNKTQQRILDAAIQCVKQWGIEKTNLNDIAKQTGVTRATVYSYFPGKNEVIHIALLQSGYTFGARLIDHSNQFELTQDRLLESVIFAVEQLPQEPYLTVITQANLSSYINQDALSNQEGQHICLAIFREIFKNEAIEDDELIEITELTTRLTLSLLLLKGPIPRSSDELRSFLKRRLLPAAGL